jgi:hypothetical protein
MTICSSDQYWFHVTTSKAFAKHVVGRALRLSVRQAKECVARAAGYEGMADALAKPRLMNINFDEWVRRLEETLAVDADELLPRRELLNWYQKLFVTHEPLCLAPALKGPGRLRGHTDSDKATDEPEDWQPVPSSVNHAQTVVDAIASTGQRDGIRSPRRDFPTRRRT